MTIDGESFDTVSTKTLSVIEPEHPAYKKQIIDLSRDKYAVELDKFKEIEEEKLQKEKDEEKRYKGQATEISEQEISDVDESVNNDEKQDKNSDN